MVRRSAEGPAPCRQRLGGPGRALRHRAHQGGHLPYHLVRPGRVRACAPPAPDCRTPPPNEVVKKRAAAAGVIYINGLKVTSHSLWAGPNTEARQGLADRREAGDWGEKSPLPDSRYNRPDDTVDATETDPLDAVQLFGKFKEDSAEP